MPEYSITTAAERRDAWVMVTPAPAPVATLGAYQISVVVPLVLVACVTRDQVAPVCAIADTLLALAPRVEITAIMVFPATGAAPIVTMKLVLAPVAVLPVALRTRAAAGELKMTD